MSKKYVKNIHLCLVQVDLSWDSMAPCICFIQSTSDAPNGAPVGIVAALMQPVVQPWAVCGKPVGPVCGA